MFVIGIAMAFFGALLMLLCGSGEYRKHNAADVVGAMVLFWPGVFLCALSVLTLIWRWMP